MAAGGEEEEVGKADAVGQPRGQRMAFEMVHGEKGLAGDERQRLGGGEPDEDAADQPGTRGRGDAVDVVERAVRLVAAPAPTSRSTTSTCARAAISGTTPP